MVHIFSPLVRIVKAGSSSSLWSSRLGLSSSFRRWSEYSLSTTVNPSMTSHGTPGWTHMTPLAVALRPAPKTILCSSGTQLSAVFKVATTVITGWGSCLWPMVLEYCQNSTIFWLLVIFHSGVQISCRGRYFGGIMNFILQIFSRGKYFEGTISWEKYKPLVWSYGVHVLGYIFSGGLTCSHG